MGPTFPATLNDSANTGDAAFNRTTQGQTMDKEQLRQRFGRPLRLGIIGGGPGVWIGETHRTAAELDRWWRVVAGVFSSDAARSRAAGPQLGIDAARSYGDVAEMLEKEARRSDPIDAVAIMTLNDAHYPYAAMALDAGL